MKLEKLRMLALAAMLLLIGLPTLAQETKETVTVDDVDRSFTVRLPRDYDAQRRYPVVVLLHGMNQDPDDMERLTRFNQLADKDGIIAVYPAALHGKWNVGVHPEERPMMMNPGRRRGYGYPGGGYPGGGGGYPRGGAVIRVDSSQPSVRIGGSPKPMTSASSTRCSISLRRSILWILPVFTQLDCHRAVS